MNRTTLMVVVGSCAIAGAAVLVCGGLIAIPLAYRFVSVAEHPAAPESRLSRLESEALIAAAIKDAVLAHAGKDCEFKLLYVRGERDGRYSAFGSVKPPDDKYGEKVSPWTAIARIDNGQARVTFLTYGQSKEVIYDERKTVKTQPLPASPR